MFKRFAVRRMRLRDLDRIEEIERASFGSEAYDRNLFAEYYDTCGSLFLVGEYHRSICGYMITCTGGDRAEVISVAVDPARRGTGVGSSLMESTLRRLRRRRIGRLLLMVSEKNETARTFYEKYGFHRIRRAPRYYENGDDAWQMSRNV